MTKEQILNLRKKLGLTQAQFGQLFGAHPITVTRWESSSSHYMPNAHQIMLMENFEKSAQDEEVQKTLVGVLVGVSVVAALVLLLKAATKGK